MNKSLQAIINEGVHDLEQLAASSATDAKRANEIVGKCKADMTTLVRFAEDLPQAMLDKMSVVLTTEYNFGDGSYGRGAYASIDIKGNRQDLRGMFGSSDETLKGRYRVIVILSKVD